MNRLFIRVGATAFLAAVSVAGATSASAQSPDGGVYQIVRASESRVWRLNTRTGEVAVCTLEGEQLLCASSEQAITPPTRSYAELEADRIEQQRLAEQRREERQRRNQAMLDLMLNTFRTLASAGTSAAASN